MSVKEYKLDVQKRDGTGQKAIKQIRRDGGIPGVYYSHDSKASIAFVLGKKELHNAIKSGAHVFNISVGGKKRNVIFKSVQYHPVSEEVQHIDLYGVKMDAAITVKVSINLIGDSIGVKEEGGVLNHATSEIEIECLPLDIPDFIEVDITDLDMGDSMQVGDIVLDEKFKLMSSAEAVLVSVTHAMREEEPVVALEDDDELFLDEDGEVIEGEATPPEGGSTGETPEAE